MTEFARIEIAEAIAAYRLEMEIARVKRLGLIQQEKEAWDKLYAIFLDYNLPPC